MDKNDQLKQLLAETKFVVEATSHESQSWWEKYSDEAQFVPRRYPDEKIPATNRYKWEQLNPGYAPTIGMFKGFPVVMHMWWFRINGVLVMFYEATSRVVDYDMIEKWLQKNCAPRWCNGSRLAHCNSSNFHHALDYIDNEDQR